MIKGCLSDKRKIISVDIRFIDFPILIKASTFNQPIGFDVCSLVNNLPDYNYWQFKDVCYIFILFNYGKSPDYASTRKFPEKGNSTRGRIFDY